MELPRPTNFPSNSLKAFTEKSRDELLKESRLLYQQLNREFRLIEKEKTPVLKDAYNRFHQFKKDFKYADFSKYSDKMVKDLYRDLKYIQGLKSSTLEGAKESVETFGDTKKFLESLSQEKQKQFWDIYNRAYKNLSPTLIERFKYDVFGVVSNEMLLGQNIDDIFEKIQEAFDNAYEEGYTEVEQGELFAENLELLFSDSFENLFDKYL